MLGAHGWVGRQPADQPEQPADEAGEVAERPLASGILLRAQGGEQKRLELEAQSLAVASSSAIRWRNSAGIGTFRPSG